jgi:hypothetical protein
MQIEAVFVNEFIISSIERDRMQIPPIFISFERREEETNSMSHFNLSACHQLEKKRMIRVVDEVVEMSYREEGASHAGN